jgi:hypothetical protein
MPEKPISHVYEPQSSEARRTLSVARWQRHQVKALPQGISLVPNGRAASIYVREGDRFVELDAELAGSADLDMSVYTEPGIFSWIDVASFDTHAATADEQRRVLTEVDVWLRSRPARFAFVPPQA